MIEEKKGISRKIRPRQRTASGWPIFRIILALVLVGAVALGAFVVSLDQVIRKKFEGKRWALPALVYARPLELYPELPLSAEALEQELQLAGYRKDKAATVAGGYDLTGTIMRIATRGFIFPDGAEPSIKVTVEFSGATVRRLTRADTGEELSLLRLDPARIGSFHPLANEDRLVYKREELPELLVKTLLAVEDQHFYTHSGVDPLGILRAMLANVRAGKTVQGGSTLTQQLVKNFYLNNERTLQRKFTELIMAVLLDAHYSKDEILTAYANEIFLGQDRGRAVHGFGLASQFYFRRELADLSPAQMAMLVGMIKGPSYYDPRREPERCLQRRQVVLDVMRAQGLLADEIYLKAKSAPLEQGEVVQNGFNRYPAFLDLVRRQLGEEYHEEDLVSNGLKILTTLDPQVQMQVERQLQQTLIGLEKRAGAKELEGAVVVSSREGGEILAVAGGRNPLQVGFNRAMDARRPIGSLIKPVVYLTALANGYTLGTPVEDRAMTVTIAGSKDWRPANYDKQEHGQVPLYQALAHSYNLSTVRIGMDIGVEKVIANLAQMGIRREFQPYPSFLLGTAELSPLEVAQVYQVMATGGFYQPQRVINGVLTVENKLVQRFGLTVEQRFPPQIVFLLNAALQRVVSEGTARSLVNFVPASIKVAAKTGTTDDLRDSWFAGFTGDRLAVVWIGRDDNKPAGLTGASGAMVAWGRIMQGLQHQPLELTEPEGIEWARIEGAGILPFISGTVPVAAGSGGDSSPGDSPVEKHIDEAWDTIRGWF